MKNLKQKYIQLYWGISRTSSVNYAGIIFSNCFWKHVIFITVLALRMLSLYRKSRGSMKKLCWCSQSLRSVVKIMVNKVVVTDLHQFFHKLVEHRVPVVRKLVWKIEKTIKAQENENKYARKYLLSDQKLYYSLK